MPEICGRVQRVHDTVIVVTECVGPVSTQDEEVSLSHTKAREPFTAKVAEFKTVNGDRWICVLEGIVKTNFCTPEGVQTIVANAGEVFFTAENTCCQFLLESIGTEALTVQFPAFSPIGMKIGLRPNDIGRIPPSIVGKRSARIHDGDVLFIDELLGNITATSDEVSLWRMESKQAGSWPKGVWVSHECAIWLSATKKSFEVHWKADEDSCGEMKKSTCPGHEHDDDLSEVLLVKEGETCFVSPGDAFKYVFLEAGVEFLGLCVPASHPSLWTQRLK